MKYRMRFGRTNSTENGSKSRTTSCENLNNLEEQGRWVSLPSVTHPSSFTDCNIQLPTPPRSRLVRLHERRFHRHFPNVSGEERLINYYHCALVSDILLQGFLYLTENYFAFYSNIFGYKTKFLIPVASVIQVTKERTAKIIPNAVGIATHEEKFVFGSLLSRDASYRLIDQIWKKASYEEICDRDESGSGNTSPLLPNHTEDEESGSGICDQLTNDDSSLQPSSLQPSLTSTPKYTTRRINSKLVTATPKCQQSTNVTKGYFGKLEGTIIGIYKLPRSSLLLVLSAILLVLLFLSATFLMYRIAVVHRRLANVEDWYPHSGQRPKQYHREKKDESKLMTEEVNHLTDSLQDKIEQLALVRKSLVHLLDITTETHRTCRPPRNVQNKKLRDSGTKWVNVRT
ncbi:uncharacterized protein LOC143239841 isoform X2 [Tachypleus tridentatus]|uniref:uncharacterized protein LOC143239841 isoform X2 n=1 Tax=Tachypleus tridentatus TaxID=6853 RepID=UPI003FD58457